MSSDTLRKYINIINESVVSEKWGTETKTPDKEKGKWEGWTLAELRAKKKKLMDKESRTPAEIKLVRQINFAIRAKTGWGKAKEQ